MMNAIKQWLYLSRVKKFDNERLIAELKMRTLECSQKQDLINELLIKLTPDPDYKGYDTSIEDGCIINPIWQMRVTRNGQELTGMPLIYWVHSHLKQYGFDPDNKLRDNQTKVEIMMEIGKTVRFPMYIKGNKMPSGERLTNLDPTIGEIEIKPGEVVKQVDLK